MNSRVLFIGGNVHLTDNSLEVIDPILQSLVQPRVKREELGSQHYDNSLSGRAGKLAYDMAVADEAAATQVALDSINALGNEVFRPTHKAIAATVLDSVWKRPVPECKEVIAQGLTVLGKVEAGFDQPAGIVLTMDVNGVSLFPSRGIEDLQTEKMHSKRLGIFAVLKGGVSTSVDASNNKAFPQVDIKRDVFMHLPVMTTQSYFAEPWKDMERWDPADPSYTPPFTRLGSRQKPKDWAREEDSLISEQRFALRLAAKVIGEDDWLSAEPPDEFFRTKFTGAFATVFRDILTGQIPHDAVPHIQTQHGRFDQRTHVQETTLRSESLGDYSKRKLFQVMYAADVSADEMKGVTKEKIEKLSDGGTPRAIYAVMQAMRDFEPFFQSLFEQENWAH